MVCEIGSRLFDYEARAILDDMVLKVDEYSDKLK